MMNLKERIDAGREGKFQGLRNGLNRVNDYIFGIQRGTITLLGGMSGTGKTTLGDFMLLNAIKDSELNSIECNVHYFSFEIDELTKKCNWLSNIIYSKHGVIVSPEKIKGFGNNRLTDYEMSLVDKEIHIVEKVFSKINFTFRQINPTGVYRKLMDYASSKGEFSYRSYIDDNGNEQKVISGYKPNNPEAYNIVVLDHMALLNKERGMDNKQVIDKYSEFCVILRNLCGYTFINISQFNDGLSTVERAKYKGVDLSPQMTDFKDTRVPFADCDVAIGLMCPYKMDMDKSLGYDITKLKENFIMFKIIKNRLSKDNVAIGLYANYKAGSYVELPSVNEINYQNYVQN